MAHGLARFVRENHLRHAGKGEIFIRPDGRPVLIRENQRRSDYTGSPSGFGEGDYIARDSRVEIFDPSYMSGQGDRGGFDPSYFGDEGEDFGRRGGGGQGRHGGGHHGHGGHHGRSVEVVSAPSDIEAAQESEHVNILNRVPKGWTTTVLTETETHDGAENAQVRIRLQHKFLAQDITFDGCPAGSKVMTIVYGDRLVFNNPKGTLCSLFDAGKFVRGLMNGQRIKEGLDIIVTGTIGAAGDYVVNLVGAKPYMVGMDT